MSSARGGLSLKAALLSCALLPLSLKWRSRRARRRPPAGSFQPSMLSRRRPLGADMSVWMCRAETQILTSETISNIHQQTLQDALARNTPGISVTDSQGSPLYSSVDFRGETATPRCRGTPEGLAVYMNGVRNNEAYGDVVNWDLIPPVGDQHGADRNWQSGLRPQRARWRGGHANEEWLQLARHGNQSPGRDGLFGSGLC